MTAFCSPRFAGDERKAAPLNPKKFIGIIQKIHLAIMALSWEILYAPLKCLFFEVVQLLMRLLSDIFKLSDTAYCLKSLFGWLLVHFKSAFQFLPLDDAIASRSSSIFHRIRGGNAFGAS